ncbi:MAG: hypothetical protein VKM34_12285 [Cyanobacteriota bacterium]|nr:hypothetical protein [Cyanobacteriota bacterium]
MADNTSLTIVSASRVETAAFSSGTLLGRCLQLGVHRAYAQCVTSGNRQPLGAIYNQALERLNAQSLVVFCHDDVWLGETGLLPPWLQALEPFDLVGVAGTSGSSPASPPGGSCPTAAPGTTPICWVRSAMAIPRRTSRSASGPAPPRQPSWMGCSSRPAPAACNGQGCALIQSWAFTSTTSISAAPPSPPGCVLAFGPCR